MEALMDSGSLGGAAANLAEAGAEKKMEKEMDENNTSSCCKGLSLKTRLTVFAICYVVGKLFITF